MAWIVGVYIGGMPVNTVMAGFPSQLFLTLAGVTLLFAMAQSNGTLAQLTHHAVRVCRGNAARFRSCSSCSAPRSRRWVPATSRRRRCSTPIAMATASRAGIPLFLMAIMVGNGANAGALSPFAPTGIIVNGIMAKNQTAGPRSADVPLQPRRARARGVRRLRALRRPEAVRGGARTVEVVDPDGRKAVHRGSGSRSASSPRCS